MRACVCVCVCVFKGEVRTINDRNICEIRGCMKNNGKSRTFKFVPGEERRPSEVQRVSRSWRLPGATPMSANLTWIRKWLESIVFFGSATTDQRARLDSIDHDVQSRPGQDWQEWSRDQFEIPLRHQAASCP